MGKPSGKRPSDRAEEAEKVDQEKKKPDWGAVNLRRLPPSCASEVWGGAGNRGKGKRFEVAGGGGMEVSKTNGTQPPKKPPARTKCSGGVRKRYLRETTAWCESGQDGGGVV